MATEKQREEQIEKNTQKSGKALAGVLAQNKVAIGKTLEDGTKKKSFMSNASTRENVYKDLARDYKHLDEELNDWTVDGVTMTGEDFFDYAVEDLPRSAGVGTFNTFSKKYLNDIIGEINPAAIGNSVAMNAAVGGMLQKDIRTLRAAVSTTLAEGAAEGLTNPEMADRMLKRIEGKAGQFTFVDRGGKNWTADNYFGMLNRTLHANAARDTYTTVATTEAGFDLYQIEGGVTGSSADHPNDPCDDWAGDIVSKTGATKGYPTEADAKAAGVFHPNCVHFLRVVLPSEIDEAQKQRAKERVEAEEVKEETYDGRKVDEVSGVRYMPEKAAVKNTTQMEVDSKEFDKAWSKNKSEYIGKTDKGIVTAGLDKDRNVVRDSSGKPLKKSRKEWFADWRKQNPNTPVESAWVGISEAGAVSFLNGRHRTSALINDERRSKIVISVDNKDVANAEKRLGAKRV